MAADFTMGLWVDAIEVPTVVVGATGGIGFMAAVGAGVVGNSWAFTLTLYLLFTGALALLFFSAVLGTRVFLVEELLWEGVLVYGCDWVWGQGYPPTLGMFSSS